MRAYLEEIRYWGFNRYGDWLDVAELCDPSFTERVWPDRYRDALWTMTHELASRKKGILRSATALGLETNVVITPNHVYLDQLRPELLAERAPEMIGQLICPSRPGSREIILENFDRYFRDLAEGEVALSAFTAFAYDFGGCACDQCHPWIVTWSRLTREIHGIARRYFPKIEPWLGSWWWSDDDYRQFAEWARREAPDWASAIVYHIPYGKTTMDQPPVPLGGRTLGFIHIGYGDVTGNDDVYGHRGATIAPTRIAETLRGIAAQGAVGFQAYSEGLHDDVNKALLGALASGKAASDDEVLREYAGRYFGATGDDGAAWARWIGAWGDRGRVDLKVARSEFEWLAGRATPGWRLEQLRSKLVLEATDRAAAVAGPRDEPQRVAAERFWEEQERLNRQVWGLGPTRYVIAQTRINAAWDDKRRNTR
jgi:hypothetical protein